MAGTALAATAQPEAGCDQLVAQWQAVASQQAPVAQAANAPANDAAAAALGNQVLGVLAQQAGARSGGLGGMLGSLMGGGAAPAQRQVAVPAQATQAAHAVQLLQAGQAAPHLHAAAVQAAALQAAAQPRGVGAVGAGQAAQAAGVLGLLGGLMGAAQAQPGAQVQTPAAAGAATAEQLGALLAAKGCRLPG